MFLTASNVVEAVLRKGKLLLLLLLLGSLTLSKNDKNGQEWTRMDKNGQEWTRIDKNGQEL